VDIYIHLNEITVLKGAIAVLAIEPSTSSDRVQIWNKSGIKE
jgi:hypothetical protein